MRSASGSRALCHRCGRGGHLARDCSQHTCFRCNAKGHMAWECAEGMTCGRCGDKGHIQRNCKNISCHRCGRRGHIAKFCKDPFAKAAEVERQEQQQASRAGSGVCWPLFGNNEMKMSVSGGSGTVSLARQREAPSPWDDLGVRRETGNEGKGDSTSLLDGLVSGQDRASFATRGTGVRSRQVTLSVSEHISVLRTKRKGLFLGPRYQASKKQRDDPPMEQDGDVETGLLRKAAEELLGSGGHVHTMQQLGDSTNSSWHGLDGYGTDDSGTEPREGVPAKLGEENNCFKEICTKRSAGSDGFVDDQAASCRESW